MSKSLFITLEGGEGTGKSTLINQLEEVLVSNGHRVVKTREPGGSALGERIRSLLLDCDHTLGISPHAELMLFLAARAQHIEELIKPALLSGSVVLCDRFNDSTIAYQGYARDLGVDYVESLCQLACHGIEPDLTLFLDVEPYIGLERTKKIAKINSAAGTVDRIEAETIAFHEKVRDGMHELCKRHPKRIKQLDASRSIDEVFTQALDYVNQAVC